MLCFLKLPRKCWFLQSTGETSLLYEHLAEELEEIDNAIWEVYCLICAGPPLNPAVFPSKLDFIKEHAHEFEWLEKYVGVPESNQPVELGLYDCQGDFKLPGNRLFCPYPSFKQAARGQHKQYGLTCHAKCYQLLQERLGYKLQYDDVWPLLDAANDDNTCLDAEYGGMTEYHQHDQDFYPLSDTRYKYIAEDNNTWMLFDPTTNEQNAQRIIKVWRPQVVKFPQVRRKLLSLYCTFYRASKIAGEDSVHKKHATTDALLWKSMAAIPAGVLRLIATKANLTLGVASS